MDKPTNELEAYLLNAKPEELGKYFDENSENIASGKKAFYYYMKDVIESKNILLKDIYITAGVSESYGGKIITMEKHTKDRDLILRLCIAGHFLLGEINRALKLYGMPPLYPKNKRDACIIVAINNRKYKWDEIDGILQTQGEEKLSPVYKD